MERVATTVLSIVRETFNNEWHSGFRTATETHSIIMPLINMKEVPTLCRALCWLRSNWGRIHTSNDQTNENVIMS